MFEITNTSVGPTLSARDAEALFQPLIASAGGSDGDALDLAVCGQFERGHGCLRHAVVERRRDDVP